MIWTPEEQEKRCTRPGCTRMKHDGLKKCRHHAARDREYRRWRRKIARSEGKCFACLATPHLPSCMLVKHGLVTP